MMGTTGNLQVQPGPPSGPAQVQPPAGPRLRMLSEGRSKKLIKLINGYDREVRRCAKVRAYHAACILPAQPCRTTTAELVGPPQGRLRRRAPTPYRA